LAIKKIVITLVFVTAIIPVFPTCDYYYYIYKEFTYFYIYIIIKVKFYNSYSCYIDTLEHRSICPL